MIATRSIKIENVTVEQNTVAATMFGANTLQSVNTSDSGVPFAQYETAITVAGVTNLRFPGGTGEVLNNLLVGSTADALAPDLVAFLDWVSAKNAQGYDLGVTLVLPNKTASTFAEVYDFAKNLQSSFPGLGDAFDQTIQMRQQWTGRLFCMTAEVVKGQHIPFCGLHQPITFHDEPRQNGNRLWIQHIAPF